MLTSAFSRLKKIGGSDLQAIIEQAKQAAIAEEERGRLRCCNDRPFKLQPKAEQSADPVEFTAAALAKAENKLGRQATPDQRNALNALLKHGNILLDWLPSTGKTSFCLLAAAMIRGRVLVLCPSADIADEWSRRAKAAGFQVQRLDKAAKTQGKIIISTAEAFARACSLGENFADCNLAIFEEIQTADKWANFRPCLQQVLPAFFRLNSVHKIALAFNLQPDLLTSCFLVECNFLNVPLLNSRPLIAENIFLRYQPFATLSKALEDTSAALLRFIGAEEETEETAERFLLWSSSAKTFPAIKSTLKKADQTLAPVCISADLKNRGQKMRRYIRQPPKVIATTSILETAQGLSFDHSFDLLGPAITGPALIGRLAKIGHSYGGRALSVGSLLDTYINTKEAGFLTGCLRQKIASTARPCHFCSSCLIRHKAETVAKLIEAIRADIAARDNVPPGFIWKDGEEKASLRAALLTYFPQQAAAISRVKAELEKLLGRGRFERHGARILAFLELIELRTDDNLQKAYLWRVLQKAIGGNFGKFRQPDLSLRRTAEHLRRGT